MSRSYKLHSSLNLFYNKTVYDVSISVSHRLLLPLVTWLVVGGIERISDNANSTSDAMFGFLYGTFPTAPSVFLYASHYSTATDLVSKNMISLYLLILGY